MKKIFYALTLTIFCSSAVAQSGEWTWMKGDSTWGNNYNTLHSSGVKGVYSNSNKVPKLYGSASWVSGNNLFLLGGCYLYVDGGYCEPLSGMWDYNVDSNKWRWISGDIWTANGNQIEYWGTQGIGDSTTFPIFRDNSATWTDLDGNFWLFSGYPEATDLWKYDVQVNIWTWIKGFYGYHYGVKGVTDTLNIPPSRTLAESWTDKQGNLWMFGGLHTNGYQYMNDLWKYNIATNEWTWVKGDTFFDPIAKYGTMGVAAPDNTPGGRGNNHLHWVDSLGNLYLFGGFSTYPFQGFHYDLWKFDVTLEQWAWIGGDSTVNYGGEYNTLCGINNYPAARAEATGWVDHQGYCWLCGGHTNLTDPSYVTSTNDLWKYDPYNNTWWWIYGDNTYFKEGVYGTKGSPSPSNITRSRYGAASWVDSLNNFWVWGGTFIPLYPIDYDYTLNDLWRYVPDSTCGVYTGANSPYQLNAKGFLITPNPAINEITIITNQQEVGDINIYDIQGALLLKDEIVGSDNTINIETLPAGIYFVQLKTGNKVWVGKMVKD